MKNKKTRLSANEINRFTYCPYQWYYGRYYGQTTIKEKYKALGNRSSGAHNNFKRGLKFHKDYYRQYKLKRMLQVAGLVAILALGIGRLMKWL